MQQTRQQRPSVAGVLELWDKIELIIEEGDRSGRYRARIEDITKHYLLIDRPTLVSGDALFTVGATFRANFFKPDSAYTFTGRIVSKQNGYAGKYLIPIPTDIERNQRRRYYRLELAGTVTIIPAEDLLAGRRDENNLPEFDARCINISGNGVLVQSRLDTEEGLRVLLTLRLEDFKRDLNAIGIIRRRVEETEEMRQYGIELFTSEELSMILKHHEIKQIPKRFQSFNEIQRTKLLNFVFEQQVEMKKKGLI